VKPLSLPIVPFLPVFVLGVHTAYQTDPLYLGIDALLCLILIGYFSLFPPFKRQTLILGLCFYGVGYLVGNIDQDYWILQKNAKVNLERLLQKAKPKHIIIDGSNSPYYRDQWVETIKEYKIPYHTTPTKDALSLF
jgi:hypothetical protein